ncbi:efflux RND transporter permease subunit [Aquisphaera insulae]|uniref:efflux RND transporter permease subunit n=1 Tax=Aquisphaera insulae TaxID=2712864 RepID=UPI0013ED8AED|nr:efflux RND transporter permease subunit [Aquisphaera insulae]
MFTRFFIDRPIFASVLSIVITLAGGLALASLPIAMFPQIAPPTVSVSCQYPGASAQVVAETVAAPIEQQVNGVENMMYMSSASTNDGNYSLTVTFKHGVDLNLAQVLVQNRVSLAVPLLPDVIKATGVTTKKRSPDILLSIGLYSPNGRYDQLYLSNYAYMRIRDELARLPGVSDVSMFGQRDYSMRIWLDPDRLAQRGLTAGDVVRALREQNLPVASGYVGQSPAIPGQQTQVTLTTLGRLASVEEFEKVIVRSTPDGRLVRVRDVARVELGAKNQDMSAEIGARKHHDDERMDLYPVANLAIFQLPDANALDTADVVKAKIEELKKDFPDGIDYMIRYDTTPFIRESIQEVFKALMDSVLLVALVVLLFLQNWRSALIPLIAVPVGIIGTFAVMAAFGFSLNNLTLFGLVLAIGIVVDDAIVVVESVEHHIEHGLSPREATIRAMSEVSAPVIAVGLVLSAVFIPCAFISGITGQFFRQFALTIASATVLSTINSLTLSPALSAMLLKPREKGAYQALPRLAFVAIGMWQGYERLGPLLMPLLPHFGPGSAAHVSTASTLPGLGGVEGLTRETASGLAGAVLGGILGWLLAGPINVLLGRFFDAFNRGFTATAHGYSRVVAGMLRVCGLVFLVYLGLLYLTFGKFASTPRGFIPSQDMGYLLVNIQLPDSAAVERTKASVRKISDVASATPGVAATVGITGQSLLLNAFGSNFGTMFVTLDEFAKRPSPSPMSHAAANWLRRKLGWKELPPEPDLYFETIMNRLRGQLAMAVPEATVSVFGPPPVRGVGRAGGWMLMIEDRGDIGAAGLQREVEGLVRKGNDGIDLTGTPIAAAGPGATPARAGAAGVASGAAAGARQAVQGLTSVFRANVPQVYLDVDRTACMIKGVALRDVFTTLQAYLGSLYVNDFNRFGRTWQVVVQAMPTYRDQRDDIRRLKVRNRAGTMVPLGALAALREINGPLVLTRYNMYPAASINGNAARGVSSGSAIHAMEELATRELPQSMSYEWTEMAFLELQAGSTAVIVFGFSIVMVFLVLAAQFESWAMPLAVILSVPLCMLSALHGVTNAPLLGANNTGLDINIFTQIGLVVLVGLASKNSILIVQFAKLIHGRGDSLREATVEACRLRLRPIIMTSMAFILGVVPLLFAHGAGAEMRQSLGVAVFSGMLGVTVFGVLLTPVFFYMIEGMAESRFFSNPVVRRVGKVLLLTLFPVLILRDLARVSARRIRARAGSPEASSPADAELDQEAEIVQSK